MPHEETHGSRNRSYSAWHRRMSTRRFVGIENAQTLAMIDLDASLYVEYDDGTKEPLALVETARDVGQGYKCATVTVNLARRSGLPAFILLYREAAAPNPADPAWRDIEAFRYRRLWPRPANDWSRCTPQEWALVLVRLRTWSAAKLDRWLDELAEAA